MQIFSLKNCSNSRCSSITKFVFVSLFLLETGPNFTNFFFLQPCYNNAFKANKENKLPEILKAWSRRRTKCLRLRVYFTSWNRIRILDDNSDSGRLAECGAMWIQIRNTVWESARKISLIDWHHYRIPVYSAIQVWLLFQQNRVSRFLRRNVEHSRVHS